MFLMTAHRTFIGTNHSGGLTQVGEAERSRFVEIDDHMADGTMAEGPLAGFDVQRSDLGLKLRKDGLFLCADPHDRSLVANRSQAGSWETFVPVQAADIAGIFSVYNSPEEEISRFRERVAAMTAAGEPVKIYCGCGDIVRQGFLHVDIVMMAPALALSCPENYFLFPFADMGWAIPDGCVDYIFHEDFIEHIDQLQQIQFLAETYRVLKKGAWHRVNTPNLLATMTRHSDFSKGLAGVYRGEKELWGHELLMTERYLKDLAVMIGYSEIVFTAKNAGVSIFAVGDLRPLSDRDEIGGNIYADLRK